jgi:hypothetical protein
LFLSIEEKFGVAAALLELCAMAPPKAKSAAAVAAASTLTFNM